MKKLKFIILSLILSMLPINVYGLTVAPQLTCNTTTIQAGKQATCEFKINVEEGSISGISAKYSYDSSYANILIEKSGTWQGNSDGGSMDFYDFEDHTGLVSIATIKYIVNDETIPSNTSSILSINITELTDENNKANKPNLSTSVSFDLKNKSSDSDSDKTEQVEVITQKASTTKPTTKISTKKTTTKKSTTTNKEDNIPDETTTITTSNETTTSITTSSKKQSVKKESKNMLIVGVLGFIFLLLLILIIILIIKEKQRKDEE